MFYFYGRTDDRMFSVEVSLILPLFISQRSSFTFMQLGNIGSVELPPWIGQGKLLEEKLSQILSVGIVLLVHINATKGMFFGAVVTFCMEDVHDMRCPIFHNDMTILTSCNTIVFSGVVTLTVVTASRIVRL